MNNKKRRFGRGAPMIALLLGLALLAGVTTRIVSATLKHVDVEPVMSVVTQQPTAHPRPTAVPTARPEITPVPPATTAPTVTPAPTPAPSANETAWNAYAKVRVATGKQLPICAAPSYSAAKIAYAENGAKLRVLAKSGDWARVTDGKHTGYVPVKYVQIYG